MYIITTAENKIECPRSASNQLEERPGQRETKALCAPGVRRQVTAKFFMKRETFFKRVSCIKLNIAFYDTPNR